MNTPRHGDLSDPLKRALVILLEDQTVIRRRGIWFGKSGRQIYLATIEALYERYLCKIIAGSKFKRRHRESDPSRMCYSATLTDVGEFAARDIAREFVVEDASAHSKISEQAAQFIVEVTA